MKKKISARKKVTVRKTKSLAKKQKKKDLWYGSQSLMQKPATIDQKRERETILVVADVLGVSPFGVNVLGNLPYINKLGRKQKFEEYSKGKEKIEYDWIQYAKDDEMKAICRARIVDAKGKELTDWIVGECSSVTMGMRTLKGYQNHMAQTRAHNRVIEERWGVKTHEDMIRRIGARAKQGQTVPMIGSTSASAEEMHNKKEGGEIPVVNYEKPANKTPTKSKSVSYECHGCGNPMSEAEVTYSKRLYKKQLCRSCQPNGK